MRHHKLPLILGLIWGGLSLGFILLIARIEPPQLVNALVGHTPSSAVIDMFTLDKIQPFLLLYFPYAIGLDLSMWTIGLIPWLFGNGSWPGEALGIVFNVYPALAWVDVILFTFLGGIAIVEIPYLIFQVAKKRILS